MRTIEISASFTGKISTGQYENSAPYFSAKEIIEVDEGIDVNKLIEIRQGELQEIGRASCRERVCQYV